MAPNEGPYGKLVKKVAMYTVGIGSSGGKGYDWGQSFNSVGESVRLKI